MTSVTRAEITAAAVRVAPYLRRTPVLDLGRGGMGGHWQPLLKLEYLQLSGSFKARGAFNSLLSRPIGPAGVTAISGGNHGAAVALAAARLGHRARVFVPMAASQAKRDLIRRYGGEVVEAADFHAALARCDEYVGETGALKVHPFAEAATIAGQGTLGLEWQGQCDLDTVLIAVGGGGLIAGVAVWFQSLGVKVIGVEPEGSCALHSALAARGPVEVAINSVAADSLGAPNVGPLVYGLCAAHVDRVVLVPDSAILAAQRALWQDYRIAAEPGGATAFAAVLSGAYQPKPGERVGLLICGANQDLAKLAEVTG